MDRVKLPAIFLIISAALGIASGLFGLLKPRMSEEQLARLREQPDVPEWAAKVAESSAGSAGYGTSILALLVGATILFGALKMMHLQSYGWAMAAAILAVIPCLSPCCCLGIPFGIWALVVLSKPEVKAAFA
jgi:predicted PurR-regulated permease PerM